MLANFEPILAYFEPILADFEPTLADFSQENADFSQLRKRRNSLTKLRLENLHLMTGNVYITVSLFPGIYLDITLQSLLCKYLSAEIILLYITLSWPQLLSCTSFCFHCITLKTLEAYFCDTLRYGYIKNCFQNIKCNNLRSTGSSVQGKGPQKLHKKDPQNSPGNCSEKYPSDFCRSLLLILSAWNRLHLCVPTRGELADEYPLTQSYYLNISFEIFIFKKLQFLRNKLRKFGGIIFHNNVSFETQFRGTLVGCSFCLSHCCEALALSGGSVG